MLHTWEGVTVTSRMWNSRIMLENTASSACFDLLHHFPIVCVSVCGWVWVCMCVQAGDILKSPRTRDTCLYLFVAGLQSVSVVHVSCPRVAVCCSMLQWVALRYEAAWEWHLRMAHGAHRNEWCHTGESVKSILSFSLSGWMCQAWVTHVPVNDSCYPVNESCHTCEWVMSHMWMSHVTHVDASLLLPGCSSRQNEPRVVTGSKVHSLHVRACVFSWVCRCECVGSRQTLVTRIVLVWVFESKHARSSCC